MKEEIIKEIKNQIQQGKKVTEIARDLKISTTSVYYYSNDKARQKRIKQSVDYFKGLSKEKKTQIYKNRNEYVRNWLNNKYKTDIGFRNKVLERKRAAYKLNNTKTRHSQKSD